MRRSLVLASFALAACGRTALPLQDLPAQPPADAGADTGPPLIPCGNLVIDGAPIGDTEQPNPFANDGQPRLVAVDAARVMVFRTNVDDVGTFSLRATAFDAWGDWPASQGEPYYLAMDIEGQPLAARGLADDAAALVQLPSSDDSPSVPLLAPSIPPGVGSVELSGVALEELGDGQPAALAAANGRFFVGHRVEVGPMTSLTELVTDARGSILAGPSGGAGCAQGQGQSEAIAIGDVFLSAFSAGREWATCADPNGVPGPPARVQVERWPAGGAIALAADWTLPEPVAELALVPRPGGAWVVVRTDGSTSFQPPAVLATPLDATGAVAGDAVVVIPDGRTSGSIAAAAFGARLAVAWVEAADPPTIGVRVFDPDGALAAETSIDPKNLYVTFNRISLVGSPAGDALVLAWHGYDVDFDIVAARLVCRAR